MATKVILLDTDALIEYIRGNEDMQKVLELLLKLQQCNVVGSGDGFPDDEEDYYEPEPECHICGKVDGHHSGCPEDNSPYAQLLRDGYD